MLAVIVPALAIAEGVQAPEKATQSAKTFFELADKGDFSGSFESLSEDIRKNKTPRAWLRKMKAARDTMGAVSSRKLIKSEKVKSFADLDKGDYLQLLYETVFENQPEATETLVLVAGADSEYPVAAYQVDFNRWPEAIKIILNGLFLVFFIMSFLAFVTWALGKIVQKYEKLKKEKEELKQENEKQERA